MSVKQMGMVWDLDLPANKKFVLLAYADHADDEGGSVFPSLARVAHKTGYSRDQVRRISKELRDANLMELVEKATHNRPAEYRLTLERGSILPPLTPRGGGANDPPQVGAPVPPESSVQPSVTPVRDADASSKVMKDPGGYFADLLKIAGKSPTDRERERCFVHLKKLIDKQGATRVEMEKIISNAFQAHMNGFEWWPHDMLSKLRQNNVTPIRPVEPTRPRKRVIS